MRIHIFVICLITSYASIASDLTRNHKEVAEILTNSFYEQIYKRVKDLRPEEIAPRKVKSLNQGKRGKLIIEQMKQRNREKIAKMRGFDPDKIKSGKDLVNAQVQDNKDILKKIKQKQIDGEWVNKAKDEIEQLKRKVLIEHKEWRKKHLARIKNWDLKKTNYLNEKDIYIKSLSEIPLVLPVSKKELKKKVEVQIKKESFIVDSAFIPDIRDQKSRPTCSSFSGIRGIEILLAQKNKALDLSEQYFYFASKPNCQNNKCSQEGSWVGYGLEHSQKSPSLDIPLEKSCQYNPQSVLGNETQIPLKNSCKNGVVKVKAFEYLKNLDEVLRSLDQNKPVVASISLSPNFYSTKGIVLNQERNIGQQMDSHAKGHSVLFVGYLKLPRALKEGSVCFITANSWGQGWGFGGHACISEKWVMEHRKTNPFVVINRIEI